MIFFTEAQLAEFTDRIMGEVALPQAMKPLLQAFPQDTHPMPVFSAGVSLFGTHGDDLDIDDPKAVDLATARLLGRGPTLAASAGGRRAASPTVFIGAGGLTPSPPPPSFPSHARLVELITHVRLFLQPHHFRFRLLSLVGRLHIPHGGAFIIIALRPNRRGEAMLRRALHCDRLDRPN